MTDRPRDRAVALLVNYLEAIATKAGMKWHHDHTAEIGEAVDAIIAAAAAAVAEAEARTGYAMQTGDAIQQRLDELARQIDRHARQLRDGGGALP